MTDSQVSTFPPLRPPTVFHLPEFSFRKRNRSTAVAHRHDAMLKQLIFGQRRRVIDLAKQLGVIDPSFGGLGLRLHQIGAVSAWWVEPVELGLDEDLGCVIGTADTHGYGRGWKVTEIDDY